MNKVPVAPFRPKSISTDEAAFASLALGRRRRLAFRLGDGQWQVRFIASKPTTSGTTVRLSDGNASAWIRLNDWNTIPLVVEFAGGKFDALPADIQSIVLEAALESTLDAFGGAVGSTWRIEEITSLPGDVSKSIGIELQDQAGVLRRGELAMDAAAAEMFSDLLERIPAAPVRSLDDVRLPVRLLLGETRIDRSELVGLRAHDVLLIDRPYVMAASDSSKIRAIAQIGEQTAFQATMENGIATLESPAPVPSLPKESTVRFEIFGAPNSIAAAKNLQSGAELSFAPGGENDVHITMSNRAIAFGPLVSCADRIGVRLRSNVSFDSQ